MAAGDGPEPIQNLARACVGSVKADTDLPFNDVAQVIDIAHAAGVDKVGLITAKIEAGG